MTKITDERLRELIGTARICRDVEWNTGPVQVDELESLARELLLARAVVEAARGLRRHPYSTTWHAMIAALKAYEATP